MLNSAFNLKIYGLKIYILPHNRDWNGNKQSECSPMKHKAQERKSYKDANRMLADEVENLFHISKNYGLTLKNSHLNSGLRAGIRLFHFIVRCRTP